MYDVQKDITIFSLFPTPMISVQEFFHDDPNNTPWKPLPEHDLKQSNSLLSNNY